MKGVISGIIVTLLLVSMSALAFNIKQAKAAHTTIIVPDEFPTIQAPINNASAGDTIYVRNGTYFEDVIVNKSVSLIGENRNTTIIDGNKTGNVLQVTADKVNVTGFTIQNAGSTWPNDFGVDLTSRKN
jgi:nitrous oxidase accessory protein NosD